MCKNGGINTAICNLKLFYRTTWSTLLHSTSWFIWRCKQMTVSSAWAGSYFVFSANETLVFSQAKKVSMTLHLSRCLPHTSVGMVVDFINFCLQELKSLIFKGRGNGCRRGNLPPVLTMPNLLNWTDCAYRWTYFMSRYRGAQLLLMPHCMPDL